MVLLIVAPLGSMTREDIPLAPCVSSRSCQIHSLPLDPWGVAPAAYTGPAFYDLIMGAPPEASGRKMRITGMSAAQLADGRINEEIGLADGER